MPIRASHSYFLRTESNAVFKSKNVKNVLFSHSQALSITVLLEYLSSWVCQWGQKAVCSSCCLNFFFSENFYIIMILVLQVSSEFSPTLSFCHSNNQFSLVSFKFIEFSIFHFLISNVIHPSIPSTYLQLTAFW